MQEKKTFRDGGFVFALLLVLLGILVNSLGSRLATAAHLPLFLDSIGTVLAAALGGYLPGIAVGYLSNIINGFGTPDTTYYASLSVLIAVISAYMARKGAFQTLWKAAVTVLLLALVGGALGSVITWLMYGFDFGTGISAPLAHRIFDSTGMRVFWSQLTADMLIDLADKVVTVAVSALALRLIPQWIQDKLYFTGWQQTPMSAAERRSAQKKTASRVSLQAKILMLLTFLTLLIAGAATAICITMNHRITMDTHVKLGQGVTNMVASTIDPDRVEDYVRDGEAADGYLETKAELQAIKDASPDIEYLYVYQIKTDGCHVVFDLDTPDTPGGMPGELVPFDESFAEDLPMLLAGQPIDPIVTDDTFGWLLTVYLPVRDSTGQTVCYACADVSMHDLTMEEISLLVKVLSLFLGFFIMILAIGLWLAEYNVILPINTMSMATSAFAYDTQSARSDSMEALVALDIHTGDEIEHLYEAISKTSGDTVSYIADIQEKTDQIQKMQNGLIMTLADMVESRDKCTGDHVRKTAAYARMILQKMKEEGVYADQVTDQFINDVANSAPLHDVGKIQVSDTLLNKPGRLTDEEFEEMKKHTIYGGVIISRAIEISPDPGYLSEARNLATYHHERWDGKGYPKGLKGEEIPLSARIMAVADVFDALVSKRSYKAPFSFEKAMDIIREESGTHFDPVVADVFLRAEQEVREIADQHLAQEALDFDNLEV